MKTIRFISFFVLIATFSVSSAFGQARKLTRRVVTSDNTLAHPPQPGTSAPAPAPAPTASPAVPRTVIITNVVSEKTKEQKAALVQKTIEFQKKRAEAGAPTAQYDLGMRYFKGDGVEKDLELAKKWLTASATNGNKQAAKKLAEINKK